MITVLLRAVWWLVARVGMSVVTGVIMERILFGRKRRTGESSAKSSGAAKR